MSTKDKLHEENKLIAADMWAVYNFEDPNKRYQKFLARGRQPLKSLVEGILLYEKVYIPTQDFLSLTILVGVLGERTVLDLLEANCIKFLRLNGALAYMGRGSKGGLWSFEIQSRKGHPDSFCAPVDTAVSWALDGLIDKPKDPLLPRLVIDATQEIELKTILDEIRHETYMDVLNSPYLRNKFALHNQDLDNLSGIAPYDVRTYGGPDGDWQGDEIDIVMSLAAANVELRLAQLINCSDASTVCPVGHLIKAKVERSLGNLNVGQSFVTLREVAGIPDIGEGVLEKLVPINKLVKLTQSRNGVQFQEWFHKNCRENPIATAREYVSLLRDIPKIQSLPSKLMRFITTTAIGSIPIAGPILGALAGATDSFFMEKWLRGNSPKYFIDDLRQLQGEPKETTRAANARKKIGRNEPCLCGSGKKYKKCCG